MNFSTVMSSIQDPNRMKGQGNGGGVREPQGPEFDSWRHQQQTHQQQGFNPMSSLASDPYGFYQQSQAFHHYPGFGVGEGNSGVFFFWGGGLSLLRKIRKRSTLNGL